MRLDGERRKGYTFVDGTNDRKTRRRRRGVIGLIALMLATTAGVIQIASAASDPPSTYTGTRLTVQQAATYAYNAGFHSEDELLAVVSIGIVESGLVTQARNWHPEFGYRPASDVIGVQGPSSVWSGGRQMHADRGAWQISSRWWPQYTDAQTDNPATAAKLMLAISRNGTDFNQWDTYKSGAAQQYFDGAHGGWPALRPIIRTVIAAGGGTVATPAAQPAAQPAATPAVNPAPKPVVNPAPKPAAQPNVANGSEIRLPGTYTTAYDYQDNNPPNSANISNPVIHQKAGGTGTYADPLTVAVANGSNNGLQFAAGTRFYVPNLRAYLIAEDTIGESSGGRVHLDIWAGGQTSTQSSAYNCMSHVTGNYLVIQNPASNYAVVPGPLAANNTCRQLFGDAVVAAGGASVPTPAGNPPIVKPTQPVVTPSSPVVTPSSPVVTPSTPVVTPSTPVVTPSTPSDGPSDYSSGDWSSHHRGHHARQNRNGPCKM